MSAIRIKMQIEPAAQTPGLYATMHNVQYAIAVTRNLCRRDHVARLSVHLRCVRTRIACKREVSEGVSAYEAGLSQLA